MNNSLHPINKGFKTKEDMQAIVLLLFILFIVFTKCYMVFTATDRSVDAALPILNDKALYTTVYFGR